MRFERVTHGARRLRRYLLRPLYVLLVRLIDIDAAWERLDGVDISHSAFGAGSIRPFAWYLDRNSGVSVGSLDELCTWLLECKITSDFGQFGVMDHWQHPVDFEHSRCGDCDDHSLWAWRKLTELGYQAEFHSGIFLGAGKSSAIPHTWVTFRDETGEWFLLESTQKQADRLIEP